MQSKRTSFLLGHPGAGLSRVLHPLLLILQALPVPRAWKVQAWGQDVVTTEESMGPHALTHLGRHQNGTQYTACSHDLQCFPYMAPGAGAV